MRFDVEVGCSREEQFYVPGLHLGDDLVLRVDAQEAIDLGRDRKYRKKFINNFLVTGLDGATGMSSRNPIRRLDFFFKSTRPFAYLNTII